MVQATQTGKTKETTKKKNSLKRITILEGALKVFGEKGYEATTISAICKSAKISDATLYEYFESKETVLFAIAKHYTRHWVDKIKEVSHYIHNTREKMRLVIQSYLEFYEENPLYTSVVLLTLKGNRNFIGTSAYQVIKDAARSVIDVFNEGVEKGIYRDDLDPYLVRNMVLGFIEHLTIQWLLIGRPQKISGYRDTIFEMVMRAIEKKESHD